MNNNSDYCCQADENVLPSEKLIIITERDERKIKRF